jgi:hypothetical protein
MTCNRSRLDSLYIRKIFFFISAALPHFWQVAVAFHCMASSTYCTMDLLWLSTTTLRVCFLYSGIYSLVPAESHGMALPGRGLPIDRRPGLSHLYLPSGGQQRSSKKVKKILGVSCLFYTKKLRWYLCFHLLLTIAVENDLETSNIYNFTFSQMTFVFWLIYKNLKIIEKHGHSSKAVH